MIDSLLPQEHDETELLPFLERAGNGCISGSVAEWPQLKPACRFAFEEITRLREQVQHLELTLYSINPD